MVSLNIEIYKNDASTPSVIGLFKDAFVLITEQKSRSFRGSENPVVCTRNILEIPARVAELVDALDLGSSAFQAWGFESPLSYTIQELSIFHSYPFNK